MRICLVTHGFPPYERTGVENYTAGLAGALAARGHGVEVFAPRTEPLQPDLSVSRETRDGYAVNWITLNIQPTGPRTMLERPSVAVEFGRFLDREHPEVVHFQHVVKLGIGLIEAARERDIPTLYTAHDYYPVCHRYTFLRPDLSHCDVRGDFMACSRCDLALAHLNEIEKLGDYQMGALPEQLTEGERRILAGILDDDPEAASATDDEFDAACDRRRELDALRSQAFSGLDRILAPTEFLAHELVRGGVERERIEVLGYGIENADLAEVPPVSFDGSRPLRIAFVGGVSKQKGVHVLIEAFRRARVDAELSIWGGSSDFEYETLLQAAAEEAGVLWHGGFSRKELPGILEEIDVVVVPSIWVENQPIVIREAFSAGRPVVASRFGALPESVRDEVDGLLFEVGDPDALADVMRRLCREPELVGRLAGGIEPVTGVQEQADDLVERYEELRRTKEAVRTEVVLPATVAAFVQRHDALANKPTRELFRRALGGLGRLSAAFSDELGGAEMPELVAEGLEERSHVQTRLRDARREVDWLHETSEGLERGRVELFRAFQHIRSSFEKALGRLHSTEAALHVAEDSLEARESQIAETEAQFRTTAELGLLALQTQQRLLSAELQPILRTMAELTAGDEADRVELPGHGATPPELLVAFRGRMEALEGLREELDWRRELVTKLDEEVSWRRRRMEDLDRELRLLRGMVDQRDLQVKQGDARVVVLERTAEELERQTEELEQHTEELERTRLELERTAAELERVAAERAQELDELQAEVLYRRETMREARAAMHKGIFGRLLALTSVGRRIEDWQSVPRPGESSDPGGNSGASEEQAR